ncbi:N-acetylmuramoyl-L-alanine amidase [Neobacillus mesonae]|uniref:N-acetylmuramoyl-L-alanine amidase n=1 Tax=Neobacillus mesonae TaxID=1193713 RepID=UPI0025733922|nr:N-acetylmuramoyl-L-alanine amidase [Neobacillus mesonae]
MKLYLDPGHGGQDPGAQGNGLNEKDITLDIALKLRKILLDDFENIDVKMSRSSDTTKGLSERTTEANNWGADFFLAIHINSDNHTAQGYEDYIYRDLSNSSTTAKYQNIIHAEVLKMNQLIDRGKKKANFHVLRESKMPAMLTENGFIDNTHDAALMKQSSWRQDVAQGHANGLAKAFGLKLKAKVPPKPTLKPAPAPAPQPAKPSTPAAPSKPADSLTGTVYEVMVGSFTSRENAEDRVAALKKIGTTGTIVTANISGKTWYRVRVGSFSNHSQAEALLSKMEKAGYNDSFIVIENRNVMDSPSKPAETVYEVMVGSFTSIENAEDRVPALKKIGTTGTIVTANISGKTWYRVRVGAFSSRSQADALLSKMEKAGYDDSFIVIENTSTTDNQTSPNKSTSGTPERSGSSGNAIGTGGNTGGGTSTGSSTGGNSGTGSDPGDRPDIDPVHGNSAGFTILGPTFLSPEHMNRFVKNINPKAPELGSFYLTFGEYYGIRGDVAFAQAILETDYFRFTGDVRPEQNNFSGLGATGSKARGASFATPEEGVLAHLQHLYAYATTIKLPGQYPLVDPRFDLVDRGSAPTWIALNGKWAVPGSDYGQTILDIYERMIHLTIQHLETTRQNLNP